MPEEGAGISGYEAGVMAYARGDFGTALREFRAEAERGNAEAQYALGCMFCRGEGVGTDHAEAARWYRLAAEQGHVGAQTDLGEMYRDGEGVPQDAAEAMKWLRAAAENRCTDAQFSLASMYEQGQGVVPDLVQAYVWYQLAGEGTAGELALSGLGFLAFSDRNRVASKLTPEQRAEAEALVREHAEKSGNITHLKKQITAVCEVCFRRGSPTAVEARDMRRAVRGGFDPSKLANTVQQFSHAAFVSLLGVDPSSELSAELARARFVDKKRTQDWVVCDECMSHLRPHLGSCFVATAACGSAQAPDVIILRQFRDQVLRGRRAGRVMIRVYETISPPVAAAIAGSPFLRRLVRLTVLKPARRLCNLPASTNLLPRDGEKGEK